MMLNKIEYDLMKAYLERKNIPIEHLEKIFVTERSHTGSGEYVYFSYRSNPVHWLGKLTLSDRVNFRIANNIYSCLFNDKDGKFDYLEIFCNGYEDYPYNPQEYEILDW